MDAPAPSKKDIQAALGAIRTMHRLGHGLFFVAFAAGFAMIAFGVRISGVFLFVWYALFIAAFIGWALVSALKAMDCPRCGKRFYSRVDYGTTSFNSFAQECMNCGLRLDGKNAGP
jgi:hypothetical protein